MMNQRSENLIDKRVDSWISYFFDKFLFQFILSSFQKSILLWNIFSQSLNELEIY